MMFWIFWAVFYIFDQHITCQATPAASPYYIGAVVEYNPVRTGESAKSVAAANVANYITILKKTKQLNPNLDIIVFPETGVTTSGDGDDLLGEEFRPIVAPATSYVPNPLDKVTPCGNKSTDVAKTLETLSCAAKQYQTYIVVNHLEKEDCTNCSSDNINIYNSNIVFDRSGTIIARYRKVNLYGELGTNVTSEPEFSTFETDFGVKFGQFICFDILYKIPALQLVKEFKVTDIVYPTHWFSQLPFFDELEIQAAWSYANNVNLLASGFNSPSTGSTGSGIYAGRDSILGTFRSETGKNAVLIANVPKIINGERDNVKNETVLYEFSEKEVPITADKTIMQNNLHKENITDYSTVILGPNMKQNISIVNNNFSCYFTHKVKYNKNVIKSGEKYYRYRFGVFAGERSTQGKRGKLQICGLIACTNDSLSSCGKRFDTVDTFKHWISFEKLEISTSFRKTNNTVFNFPVSVQTNLMPLKPSDFLIKSSVSNKSSQYDFVSLSLEKPESDLLSFGILGVYLADLR